MQRMSSAALALSALLGVTAYASGAQATPEVDTTAIQKVTWDGYRYRYHDGYRHRHGYRYYRYYDDGYPWRRPYRYYDYD